jgi:hypothetical protein
VAAAGTVGRLVEVMNGWLIRIRGWETPEPIRLFAAAESNPRAALVAVQKATGAAPKLCVETIGQISTQTVRELKLEPGQVRDLSSFRERDERPFGFFLWPKSETGTVQ